MKRPDSTVVPAENAAKKAEGEAQAAEQSLLWL
jgi:hypothetical protein